MKIIGMIPARGGSSRFHMKPLAQICGKPMLYWVWKHSKEVECFEGRSMSPRITKRSVLWRRALAQRSL